MAITAKSLRSLLGCLVIAFSSIPGAANEPADTWKLIEANWPRLLHRIEMFSRENAKKTNLDLYYLELWTYDLMRASIAEQHVDIRNSLLKLYNDALDNLVKTSSYKYYYDPRSDEARVSDHPLPQTTRLWRNQEGIEIVLSSAQFIFLLAATSRQLAQLETLDEPARTFLARAVPVVQEHLLRWIRGDKVFQVRGWACGHGLYNHREFLKMKRLRAFENPDGISYCNMVSDEDLWIISAAAELIASQTSLGEALRLSSADQIDLRDYLHAAGDLLRERTASKQFQRPDGSTVEGLVFDAGAADDHPDNQYALFSGEQCPSVAQRGAKGAGWDTSHGTRQPVVFNSLLETKPATGMDWPDEQVLGGFGRAFVYGVFEGDLTKPRLRNYLDGSNGWYRVEEDTCTGYRPYGMSYALVFGAWGRYAPYTPELANILQAARRILTSQAPADVAFRSTVWDRPRYVNGRPQNEDMARASVSVWTLPLLTTYAIGSGGHSAARP